MTQADFFQGDIIRIGDSKHHYLVLSKNAFIRNAGVFHICPFLQGYSEGPVHIFARGEKGTEGIAVLEQIKLIDPEARRCRTVDRLSYRDIMEISDALQSIFEYD